MFSASPFLFSLFPHSLHVSNKLQTKNRQKSFQKQNVLSKPLKLFVHLHRLYILLLLEILYRVTIAVILNLHSQSSPLPYSLILLLRTCMRDVHTETLLHVFLRSVCEFLQHADNLIVIIRHQLLAQCTDLAGV